ncbi:OsmC-like protein [Elysia marginata]|uniref:OsmC-like protein n=1 Tax=Elysia marginata TaxID=1093978 RepID=A0AAV4F118_9GAST|nr:OsmC-like protein [Elysia marginata]
MKSEDIKNLQTPIKERYKKNPEQALLTLKAHSKVGGEGLTCSVETGKAIVEAGLHPATGGDGESICSGNMLLEALAACFGVTLKAVATAIDFKLKNGAISVEGDLDFRGTLGVERTVPVGFQKIRVTLSIETEESKDRIDTLLKLTERYCVVYQTLSCPPKVEHKVCL